VACNWGELPKGKWKPGQGKDLKNGMTLADHFLSKGITELGDIKKINGKTIVTGFVKHMQEVEEQLWETFQGYNEWKKRWYAEYLRKGYFDLLTGFRCSGVMAKNNVINYPGQGTGFHCLLWSFNTVDDVIYERQMWDTKLIGQIHDSLILDVNPGELEHVVKVIRQITEQGLANHWKWINVPMKVDMEIAPIDRPWSEKDKLKF
jgi:DNA polymerase I-like protein with 3'-5' exonuclease and polymerase domains